MNPTWLCAPIVALICTGQPVQSAELSKIERTIAKEPVYQTKTPKYCLMVLGPEAKTRVWLVIDGNTLYVDRNGDGDLTGPGERVERDPKRNAFEPKSLVLSDGTIQYSNLLVRVRQNEQIEIYLSRKVDFLGHRKKEKGSLMYMAGITGISSRSWMNRDNIEEYDFRFADRPQDAPIVHFNGPLTLKPMDTKQTFVRGDKPNQFAVMVGTPGLGKGTFTQVLFWEGDPGGVAEIAFPNQDPSGKPIVVKVELKSPG